VAAPSGLSYTPQASAFVVGYPINSLTPAVTGTVTGYAVNPALPAGLSLDATTGAITGTPTAIAAAASYVVTASNSSGATSTNVSIRVDNAPPVVAYERAQLTLTTGLPVTLAPMSTGGAVTAWNISPALPAGLAFDTTNGTISGTPTVTSGTTQYVVSAQNSSGSAMFGLSIRIDSGVLLDLGHATEIKQVRHDGNRVLSVDAEGHWVLWNAATTVRIASGDVPCQIGSNCTARIELAGGVAAVGSAALVQVRSASDGRILFSVPAPVSWWELAADGSYITAGTSQALTAWSPTGTMLFTRTGNYSQVDAHAAATEVRVAKGPAGANLIEKVAVATGAAASGPAFQGTFHSWFLDGERFFTSIGNTIWVYGHDSQQQDLKAMPTLANLTGQGHRFWTREGAPIVIYTVGASGSPTATFPLSIVSQVIPSRLTIGVLINSGSFSVIDLASTTPTKVDVTTALSSITTYAARSDSGWFVGTNEGVVVDETNSPASPTYFGSGRAIAIAASGNRIVVSTRMDGILIFNAATREQEGRIDSFSSVLELSSDGTVLALANGAIYSLPSGALIETQHSNFAVALSGSGQVLGRLLRSSASGYRYRRVATAVGGGAELWSDTLVTAASDRLEHLTLHLSPSGTHIAAPDGSSFITGATNLIVNGSLMSAVQGAPLGWIDEDRLLLNQYGLSMDPIAYWYATSVIASPSGRVLHTVKLPNEIWSFQTVNANRIYSPQWNQIYSLDSGAIEWASASSSRGLGGVTDTHVVFVSGNTVRMEPY
jgi:hypothetical protein